MFVFIYTWDGKYTFDRIAIAGRIGVVVSTASGAVDTDSFTQISRL